MDVVEKIIGIVKVGRIWSLPGKVAAFRQEGMGGLVRVNAAEIAAAGALGVPEVLWGIQVPEDFKVLEVYQAQ